MSGFVWVLWGYRMGVFRVGSEMCLRRGGVGIEFSSFRVGGGDVVFGMGMR